MLERTATTIEPCSLQRVLPVTRTCLQSRRQLHTAFWQHGAAELELLDVCQAIMRLPPSDRTTPATLADSNMRPDTMRASGVLLDFLYPRGTAALLRRLYPMHLLRLGPSPGYRRPVARLFTSAPPRRRHGDSDPPAKANPFAVARDIQEDDVEEDHDHERDADSPEEPAEEEDVFSDPDALRKLLHSDRAGAYDQVYQLYTNLEPSLKDDFTTHVLLAISASTRPIEAWRVNELFELHKVDEWTEQLVRAAVKAQLTLHNSSEALSIFRTAMEQRGFGRSLDYLLASGLELASWDMVLEAWGLYSALKGDEEPAFEPPFLPVADSVADAAMVHDADFMAEPAPIQDAKSATGADAVPDPQPVAESPAAQDADHVADDLFADQSLGPTATYPTLAAMPNFQAQMTELYQSLENDPDTMPQRTALADSLLVHLAKHSLGLFQPSDAVFILDRAKDPRAYERYILMSAEQERKRLASDLYRKYRALPDVRVAESVLRVMINIFFPHNVRGMEQLLEDWYRHHGGLDERAYHKFMAFHGTRGDVHSIMRLAKEYATQHNTAVDADPKFTTNLMHAHAVRGDPEAARQVMEEAAEKTGTPPDVAQWNILLNAHTKAGDYKGSINLFFQIYEEHEPDKSTFGAIMAMASWRGDLQFNLQLFQMARTRGIEPNVAMMRTVVESYCQNDRYAEAEALCTRLTKQREMKGSYTYLWNSLLKHNARRRDLSTVNRLLETMSSEGIAYNQETYSQLLLALLYCRQSHHAMHLLRVAHREGVFEPTPDHFLLLMAAFLHSGEPHMALKTNELMSSMNYPKSAKRMTKVIDALGRWQQLPSSKRRNVDSEYFLKHIMREFYKAMEREDEGGPDDIRSVIGLYSKVLFILTQMREHATVQQIIALYNTRYPARGTPETLPLKLLHNIMLADFHEKKYDRVKEVWSLVLGRATVRYKTAAALLNKEAPEEGSVVYAQRFRLCDPLKTMQRVFLDEQDAKGLVELVATVQSRGFDLDSKNWNYHVQALARLKKWRDAFSVCERVLMPQWTGWYMVRAREAVKNRVPLELRRVGTNPHRPRPIAHTLLLLAKEYMDLEQMMLWSHEASREFQFVTKNCPKTVKAVTSMMRSGSDLEAEIFGEERRPRRAKQAARGRPGKKSRDKRNVPHQDVWTDGGLLNVVDKAPKAKGELSAADILAGIKGEERGRKTRDKRNVPYHDVWTDGGLLNVVDKAPKAKGELSAADILAGIKGEDQGNGGPRGKGKGV
ncbi:TPR-like protein [Trichocladium antarcticum]|uniref:TPR-like protein n=1 Tax=Trichocladium antarcticum TaxID=1450529 RepID=A0AAN6UJU8_9PEZI|nr:TPR-like protein [Trichocladium antarcticum]